MRIVISCTDALIYILLIGLSYWLWTFKKTDEWQQIRKRIIAKPRYLVALMVLAAYGIIGFLDTLHFTLKTNPMTTLSVLDVLFKSRAHQTEITYSAPFATQSYSSELEKDAEGKVHEVYTRLKYAGQNLNNPKNDKRHDIGLRIIFGIGLGLCLTGFLYGIIYFSRYRQRIQESAKIHKRFWRVFWLTLATLLCVFSIIAFLLPEYHILGTDKVGRDVLYIAVKSIRTGLVIGTVTLLVALPFALLFGMWAGYFGGWVGDSIQYTYTLISSIPGVLLIAASMLSFQAFVESDPDLRLVILCVILGVTSWTTLCRLLRGETLKLRESDYVQSAIALGARPLKIIRRHIMPNLMHIVIISVVLDFSGLVLAEAVLSYVGVGVDPTSYSWGNMINASRLEMSRDPIVWWSLLGALILMFTLVFSANIFADALQDALNPRTGEK